ncbi:MAG: DUF1489 domain-containing protein [Pseudomonadota bacterium]
MSAPLHMLKLCVGADGVDDLRDWQAGRIAERRAAGLDPRPRHVTRMWPRRSAEILDGGSLFWVFRGAILARQRIEDLQEVIGLDGIKRCAIVMSPDIVLVDTRPRRPFQGWRYLEDKDAPKDIRNQSGEVATLPPKLALALDDLGVISR